MSGSNGNPWICQSVHRQSTDYFQGQFWRPLRQIRSGTRKIAKTGLKVNAAKSTFGVHECEYLGYVLTWEGIRPQKKKIEDILAINPPKNVKDLRGFLGIVQYYRDLWEKQSKMLAPLSDLVAECGTTKSQRKRLAKRKCHGTGTKVHQEAFDDIKEVIARDVVLAYPDFEEDIQNLHRRFFATARCSHHPK